jgi:toxin secretion/phage lysis holin
MPRGKEKAMKEMLCIAAGVLGSGFASVFGGWDAAIVTLVVFMAMDYVTGMLVAGVFKRSPKTEGGGLESRAGWKGLIRKGVTLLIVVVAARLDLLVGDQSFIRDGVVIAFLVNETLSIVENAGLMGVPIPQVLVKAIEVLKQRSEGGDRDE